jgi:Fe-S oxidoreductase
MQRSLAALRSALDAGLAVIGLEPSCLLTFRDELQAVFPGDDAKRLGQRARLFEEFVAEEADAGRFALPFRSNAQALLHGHCHQKAFGVMPAIEKTLGLVDGLSTKVVESSCCGMAGAFGYKADTYEVSLKMAELSLLPAVRRAKPNTVVVADGFSCRHQIQDGTGIAAEHVARFLARSIAPRNFAETIA